MIRDVFRNCDDEAVDHKQQVTSAASRQGLDSVTGTCFDACSLLSFFSLPLLLPRFDSRVGITCLREFCSESASHERETRV